MQITPLRDKLLSAFVCGFLCWLPILLVVPPGSASAYPNAHGPFTSDQATRYENPVECVRLPSVSQKEWDKPRIYGLPDGQGTTLLQVEFGVGSDSRISITNLDGQPLSNTFVSDFRGRGEQVYTGDFNGDGVLDFFIIVSNTGNGLAATLTDSVFCLSKENRFEMIGFVGFHGKALDVIRTKKDGPWHFITTELVSNQLVSPDRPRHNFWLFQLYRFEGVRLVESTALSTFPKFVWYTHAKNHQETTRLTTEEKIGLLELVRSHRETTSVKNKPSQTTRGFHWGK